jgi:F0F1-type ATP synthase membrane subunit a
MFWYLLQVDTTGITHAASGVVNTPESFFTVESFTTLAGATGIVYIVCGAIQRAFNYSPKWLALAISMLVSFIAAIIAKNMVENGSRVEPLADWVRFLIAFLNGFLIYMSATGTNELLAPNPQQATPPNPPNPPTPSAFSQRRMKRSFRTRWWK